MILHLKKNMFTLRALVLASGIAKAKQEKKLQKISHLNKMFPS